MSGHDSKYFSTTKKGEIPELKEELNSQYKDKRKDAVKKVIAAMTVGKDVSSLFTDVVNCMQTENLELKKLVYLYLINYAKSQPDLAILAVNTFVKILDNSVKQSLGGLKNSPNVTFERIRTLVRYLSLQLFTHCTILGATTISLPYLKDLVYPSLFHNEKLFQ